MRFIFKLKNGKTFSLNNKFMWLFSQMVCRANINPFQSKEYVTTLLISPLQRIMFSLAEVLNMG